jgi:hypothetical protein
VRAVLDRWRAETARAEAGQPWQRPEPLARGGEAVRLVERACRWAERHRSTRCFVTTFRRGPMRCQKASGSHTQRPHAPLALPPRRACSGPDHDLEQLQGANPRRSTRHDLEGDIGDRQASLRRARSLRERASQAQANLAFRRRAVTCDLHDFDESFSRHICRHCPLLLTNHRVSSNMTSRPAALIIVNVYDKILAISSSRLISA